MTVKADGNGQDGPIDLKVDEEALERYHRRRISEIKRDERPASGRFIPMDELKRIADEQQETRSR
jgi:hypothetical protein